MGNNVVLYIWLLFYNVAIYCAPNAGCIQTSMAHFNYLVGIGAIELIFELHGMVKIYEKKKFDNDKGPQEPQVKPKTRKVK